MEELVCNYYNKFALLFGKKYNSRFPVLIWKSVSVFNFPRSVFVFGFYYLFPVLFNPIIQSYIHVFAFLFC